jgi:phosphohistidine swiveling domain-containing protein
MTTEGDEVVFPAQDEIDGFWNLDKMHAPRPVTPLSFDLIVRTLAEGFTKAHEDYDCPIMVATKEINHYLYFAFHPLPDEAEVARRMEHYHEKLAEKVPTVGRTWDEVWKPAVIARNVALKAAPWSDLTDAEVLAKLDELTDYMRYQWWIHGHVNFVLLSSSAFADLYDKVMQPEEPTEAYRMLQGFPTTSVDAAKGLWVLSRLALTSPVLSELFDAKQGVELLAAMDETDEGREFRGRLDEFLFEFGWRHDAVYDLADVPWHEDPSIPLGGIRAMMALPDSEDPELQYQANVAARETLFTRLRARLADDPDTMAKLDELYEAARYSFPLTEDHAFYIDQMYVAVFRRFILAVGDRLVAKGVFDQPDDVFYLYRDELVEAFTNGVDRRTVVAGRRASFERAGNVIPPSPLGTPPPEPEVPDPYMEAVVTRLLGVRPPEESTDPNTLKAVAGSPGVYTGKARVCRSLAQATDELEEGEIMVVEMTLPPWVPLFSLAGAVVTDVGGILSHSAIVARECGVPAVVGTNIATAVINTGQTITVDGNNGVVYVDGRQL